MGRKSVAAKGRWVGEAVTVFAGAGAELAASPTPREKRPNLRALQIFEAVARLQSLTRAATELGISQSAVSHQLRLLTEEVGERLLLRSGRGVVLSEAGRRLGDGLQAAFSEIDRSFARAVGGQRRTLRIAVCSSFAPGWLIHRLPGFIAANPDIDLQLRMYAKDPDLTDHVADAFVTTLPKEPGFWSHRLQTEILVPVFAAQFAPFTAGSLPLVTTDMEPERPLGEDWRAYCRQAGLDLDSLRTERWLQVSHYILALEMALNGLGVALVPDFLAARDLDAGRLVRLAPGGLCTEEDYYLCIKQSRRGEPGLQAVARWFKAQMIGGANI